MSVGASASLKGQAAAHIVPRLAIGIDLLQGSAKATVFADVDGFAKLDFGLTAAAGSSLEDSFNSVATSFGGNLDMDLGVAINVGADAALG